MPSRSRAECAPTRLPPNNERMKEGRVSRHSWRDSNGNVLIALDGSASAILLVALVGRVLGNVALVTLFVEIFRHGVATRGVAWCALGAAWSFRAAAGGRYGRRFRGHMRLLGLPSAATAV